MNTPLLSLAFPGCVTLGKSLPLSEPKVPLLEVQIVKSYWGLGGCAYFWHSGCVASLQKHRHTPPHGLRRHCFCEPGSPFPEWPGPVLSTTLPSCWIHLHGSNHCLRLGGFAGMSTPPPPQTSSLLAHLAHCHVPCTPERNDTGKSPVRAGGGGGVNENHLASHPPCEALTPKPGAGGFHGPLPAFPDSNLFQANPPQMLPLPAPCCPCCWVLGQGDLWGIRSG